MKATTRSAPESWIKRLFERLKAIYGHKWTAIYKTEDDVILAITEWSKHMGDTHPALINMAISRLVNENHEWPPSLPEFKAMCKPTAKALGLPELDEVIRVVIRQINYQPQLGKPIATHQSRFQHLAIFETYKRLDTFALQTATTKEINSAVSKQYLAVIEDFANGAKWEWPEQNHKAVIKDFSGKAVTPDEKEKSKKFARDAITKLKEAVCA